MSVSLTLSLTEVKMGLVGTSEGTLGPAGQWANCFDPGSSPMLQPLSRVDRKQRLVTAAWYFPGQGQLLWEAPWFAFFSSLGNLLKAAQPCGHGFEPGSSDLPVHVGPPFPSQGAAQHRVNTKTSHGHCSWQMRTWPRLSPSPWLFNRDFRDLLKIFGYVRILIH